MKRLILWVFAVIGFLSVLLVGSLSVFIFNAATVFREKESAEIEESTLAPNTILTLKLGGKSLGEKRAGGIFYNLTGAPPSLHDITRAIYDAAQDTRVAGLLVDYRGASIPAFQAQELRQAFQAFKKENKPIYAFSISYGDGGNNTSAYSLISLSSEIWIQPRGTLAFVGFSSEDYFLKPFFDKYKIQPQFDQRERYKGLHEQYTSAGFSPETKKNLTDLLMSVQTQIIDTVATDRDISKDKLQTLINEGPFTDQEAKEHKLVDKIGYLDDLRSALQEKSSEKVRYMSLGRYHRSAHQQHTQHAQKIAVITVDGGIVFKSGGVMSDNDQVNIGEVVRLLKKATKDEAIKAIVLRIDSPGGTVSAAETLWYHVRQAVVSGKPLVVSMAGMAASAGYMIAAPATKIVANPSTITGSIGVATGKIAFGEALRQLEVHSDSIQTADNANLWSSFQPFSEKGWSKVRSQLDYYYQDFMKKVSDGRKIPINKVREIAQGKVYTGVDAQKVGLVDILGGLETAIEVARDLAKVEDKSALSVEFYTGKEGLFGISPLGDWMESVAFSSVRRLTDRLMSPVSEPLVSLDIDPLYTQYK